MRIALAGPSGSGKTTLAKALSSHLRIPFMSNSAGDILLPKDKEYLEKNYGYKSIGHQNVIQLGHREPNFAYEFQRLVKERRAQMYGRNSNFICDRSFVDCAAYYVDQVSVYQNTATTKAFLDSCELHMKALVDCLIWVRVANPEDIEDNGSRVANLYYQRKMDKVFELAVTEIKAAQNVKTLVINYWDFDTRVSQSMAFIKKTRDELKEASTEV